MTELLPKAQSRLSVILTGAPSRADLSQAYKIYILLTMALVQLLAMVDRNILAVLLVPIQQDIGASDTAMGLLTGTAFAVFYATAAIPIARIADRGNRRTLIAIALAIWSAATSLCALATTYFHLLLGRIGVASAESAASPAIVSMIPDLFPPKRRATAMAAPLAGATLGVLVGAVVGGWLYDLYGWHFAFFVIGIPGIILALVIWLTVPEPVRGVYDSARAAAHDSETVWQQLRQLLKIPCMPWLIVGKCFMQMAQFAWLTWVPALLIRHHGMSITQMGLTYGLAVASGGILAHFAGGAGSDYLARKGARWYLIWTITALLLTVPLASFFLVSHFTGMLMILGFLTLYSLVNVSSNAPLFTISITVVRPNMRAFMTAVTYFCTNMAGVGVGPVIVGVLSDSLKGDHGDDALRLALFSVPVMYSIAAAFFVLANRTTEQDVQKAQA